MFHRKKLLDLILQTRPQRNFPRGDNRILSMHSEKKHLLWITSTVEHNETYQYEQIDINHRKPVFAKKFFVKMSI